jgi:flagellar basal body rod protein FlgF
MFIFLACLVYADNGALRNDFFDLPDLSKDYRLLYTDLSNIRTWAYKSFYSGERNRSGENINISQGALRMTGNKLDFAVHGEGFFKIRLNDNRAAYTRNGSFKVDPEGVIVTFQDYPLYDSIVLEEYFLPESLRITRDHDIYVHIAAGTQIVEKKAGTLLTYRIPAECLEHYEGAIYTIKDGAEYREEPVFDNRILQGALELGNYELLPLVLRMYYILSVLDESAAPNIEFKRELLKIQIENMADGAYFFDKTAFSLNRKIDSLIGVLEDNALLDKEDKTALAGLDITGEYLDNKLYYVESILPFIAWDY